MVSVKYYKKSDLKPDIIPLTKLNLTKKLNIQKV